MSHTCCDPNRVTQCRAHSVAADSRSFTDLAGTSRCPKTVSHQFSHPCLVFGVFGVRGGGSSGSARGVAGRFASENGSRYTGVS